MQAEDSVGRLGK